MASFTPRRVQLVCRLDAQGIPRERQRARATQTQVKQRDAATTTAPALMHRLREEIRNEILAEMLPLLERSTLAAEAALATCEGYQAECKRLNLAAFAKMYERAAAVTAERRAAAADRAAVEHALAQNEGLIDLLRARVRSAEARSSLREDSSEA